jgi:catechol 2,3-dioxygenase-like lactoylglutathione lyase family enzyme
MREKRSGSGCAIDFECALAAFQGLRAYCLGIVLEPIRSDHDDNLAEQELGVSYQRKRFEMAKAEKAFSDALRVDLYAGYSVKDYASARAWYERLLGCPPTFLPEDGEAVWELAEYRYVFIKVRPEHAGNGFNLFFLSDLEGFIAQIAERGLHPTTRETLSNGVRRAIFRDPDGNEIWLAGAPPDS